MGMDPKTRIQVMMQESHGPLDPSLLTSKIEWRKLNIEGCPEKEPKGDLDCAMCCCLGFG
jgi:hypothetical protein